MASRVGGVDHSVERMLSDLRGPGDVLEDLGDGWYAAPGDTFLHLTGADLAACLAGMADADVEGVWPEASLDEARFRLASMELEELLHGAHRGARYVVVDGTGIRNFDTVGPAPVDRPPGHYEWRPA